LIDRKVYQPIGSRILPPRTHLTPCEKEVLTLAAAGQRSRQIARTLWLSRHTVKNHLTSAYCVLEVSDLAEALLQVVVRAGSSYPLQKGCDNSRGERVVTETCGKPEPSMRRRLFLYA
jgi:DNA-binding CsgD family transcriptional regulator